MFPSNIIFPCMPTSSKHGCYFHCVLIMLLCKWTEKIKMMQELITIQTLCYINWFWSIISIPSFEIIPCHKWKETMFSYHKNCLKLINICGICNQSSSKYDNVCIVIYKIQILLVQNVVGLLNGKLHIN
jgi:hypothetical protein